jgi:carbonic anhydrase/acetyltransferase-like protein (isoleucine patch superfamily)
MTIYRIGELTPEVDDSVYVAKEATVIGNVRLEANTSVWPGAVLRADNDRITIGRNGNVQEGAVLHVDPGFPMQLGENVTIGHQAMLHGCTVGDCSLIGIQAVLLNGAVIGKNCIVGAGAVVTEGKVFPDRSLILGAPAKVVRQLSDAEVERLQSIADGYVRRRDLYKTALVAID